MSIYDFTVQTRDGTAVPLSEYQGKVLLIVNTAAGYGFTGGSETLAPGENAGRCFNIFPPIPPSAASAGTRWPLC